MTRCTGECKYRCGFYMIAAWLQEDHLESTGYVLDQIDLFPPILAAERTRKPAPPLGPFKTFQVPVRDIADLILQP